MRVTLVHNPNAGWGVLSRDDLVLHLTRAGHEVSEATDLDQNLGHHLRHDADAVVAAGGDGTMVGVARRLLHKPVPMVVIPIGTANNFGRSLGMKPDVEMLLDVLKSPVERTIDLGVATGTWGTEYFIESAGVGWFADALSEAVEPEDKALPRAREVLTNFLDDYRPQRWELTIDGEDHSGDYLLIDVMNAGMLGPNICLGSEVNPSDGFFEVALVGPSDRQLLIRYLRALKQGHTPEPPPLHRVRGRHVRIALGDRQLRVDGSLHPKPNELPSPAAELRVLPGAVRVWLPKPALPAREEMLVRSA